MLTPKALQLIARAAVKAKAAPSRPWIVRSGSGMRIPEVKIIRAARSSGVVWMVKYRRQTIAEFTGPEARATARAKADQLRPVRHSSF